MDFIKECENAILKGFVYDFNTGKILGIKGNEINKKTKNGYIQISFMIKNKRYYISGHRFGWYFIYKTNPKLIDHIDRDKTNNRLQNLRESTKKINALNNNSKGCNFDNRNKKYASYLVINSKKKHLGYFDKETDAIENTKNFKSENIKKEILKNGN